MTKRRRQARILGLSAAIAVAGLIWLWLHCPSEPGTIERIELFHESGSATGDYAWMLVLVADRVLVAGRNEKMIVATRPGDNRGQVPPDKVTEIREAIREYRFCELPAKVGYSPPSSTPDHMRIVTTEFDKTITIGIAGSGNEKVRDKVRRARRLWEIIESAIEPPAPGM